MKTTYVLSGLGLVTGAVIASSLVISDPQGVPLDVAHKDMVTLDSRTLGKRDAYSCYGSNADTSHCQGAINQIQKLGDQEFQLYPGLCLSWSQETCNIRFCSQPWVVKTVNRTAAWIFKWANGTLMNCARGSQYALMGDSTNLNGNGGTYRVHIEPKISRVFQ